MRFAIALGCFVGLVAPACGDAAAPSSRVEMGGVGDAAGAPGSGGAAVATGGMAGMPAAATGGTGSVMATGGAGGVPGSGGTASGGTGSVVGTGGAATGGTPGTGGHTAPTACSYPGATFTKDGMYRGVSTGGACGPCSTDKDCTTAYGADEQCMAGSCTLVGPWGPMPRQTCNQITAQYAIGQATTTSAVATDPSNTSCASQAQTFLGNRPSIALCKGVPMNYSGTVLAVTNNTSDGWSDSDGNCPITVITQLGGSNGCQFDATFNLLAQAPPKGTGPFQPPTCN